VPDEPVLAPVAPEAVAPTDVTPTESAATEAAATIGAAGPAHVFRAVMVQLGIPPLPSVQDLAAHPAASSPPTCVTIDASGAPVSGSSSSTASADDAKAQRLADEPQTVRGPPMPLDPPSSPVAGSASAPAAATSAGVAAVATLDGSFTVPVPETDPVTLANPHVPAGPAASCHAARAPPAS